MDSLIIMLVGGFVFAAIFTRLLPRPQPPIVVVQSVEPAQSSYGCFVLVFIALMLIAALAVART